MYHEHRIRRSEGLRILMTYHVSLAYIHLVLFEKENFETFKVKIQRENGRVNINQEQ